MYASLNAHLGFLPSMASELECIAYTLLSLAGVQMPWLQGDVLAAINAWCATRERLEVVMMQAKVAWYSGVQARYRRVIPSTDLNAQIIS